jgi:hypothetical protein
MQSLIISRQQKLGGFRCVCVNDADFFTDCDDTSRRFECDAVKSWYTHADVYEESLILIIPTFYFVHGRSRFVRNVGTCLTKCTTAPCGNETVFGRSSYIIATRGSNRAKFWGEWSKYFRWPRCGKRVISSMWQTNICASACYRMTSYLAYKRSCWNAYEVTFRGNRFFSQISILVCCSLYQPQSETHF